MINIKIITFIIVIILLLIIYFFYKNRENFTSKSCSEFANVNIVFHKFEFEPTHNGKKLFNYVNNDFLDRFLVNNMNSIFKSSKIRFNNINLIEEDMKKNLRTHYDNFKLNYKSYDYLGKQAEIRRAPKNESLSSTNNKNYKDFSELISAIKNYKSQDYPSLPIRKEKKLLASNIALIDYKIDIQNQDIPELDSILNDSVLDKDSTNMQSSSFQMSNSLNQNTNTNETISNNEDPEFNSFSQSASDFTDILLDEEDTAAFFDINKMRIRTYDRMPILQRFLIDKGCEGAYNALTSNNYDLETLISEGQKLYESDTVDFERNTNFDIWFDKLGIPKIPDKTRINLRESIINYEEENYPPAIIDDAVIIYTDVNFGGEAIILTEGEYNFDSLNANISSEYYNQLQEDKDREFTVKIGNSSSPIKTIVSATPYINNPYGNDFFFTGALEIEPINNYDIEMNNYEIKVSKKGTSPGWGVNIYQLTQKEMDIFGKNVPPYYYIFFRTPNFSKSMNGLTLSNEYFKSIGFDNYFTVTAETFFKPNISGTYKFLLASDDGSLLWIFNTSNYKLDLVINNDGVHSFRGKWGSIYLDKDVTYFILVQMFEYGGVVQLGLNWLPAGVKQGNVGILFTGGYHYPFGWNDALETKAKYINGNVIPINSLTVPEGYILEVFTEDNFKGKKYYAPEGEYQAFVKNIYRFKSYKVIALSDENMGTPNTTGLVNMGSSSNNGPNMTDYPPINMIEVSIEIPTLPVDDFTFKILKSTDNYYFPNYGNRCKPGEEVSENECLNAVKELTEINNETMAQKDIQYNGTIPEQSGSNCLNTKWGIVPQGCSAQYGDDWSAYFRESENKDDCVDNNLYRRVCKRIDTEDSKRVNDSLLVNLLEQVNQIKVNGPNKICNEMLDKFVEIDIYIIKNALKKKLSKENVKILLNLLIQSFDLTNYNDNDMHIYLLPFLPNNEKYYVIKGMNGKPLLLISLYDTSTNNKNIQSYDTTTVCKTFLSDYLKDKLQLIKFQQEYDKLLNGDKIEIKKQKDIYDNIIQKINKIKNKYPNLSEIIKKYNCIQKQLIEIYSKDYMKTQEIIKLKRLKHKGNYKVLVENKIKELKAKDQIVIDKLIKESLEYKTIIDQNNNELKELVNESENIKIKLVSLYAGSSDKKLKDRYKTTINILQGKTKKLTYLMNKLGPPILLSKIFCTLNGLDGCTSDNKNFNVLNSIKNNGIILEKDEKELMYKNAKNKIYNKFLQKDNKNYIDRELFMNVKCELVDLKTPEKVGFSKNNYKKNSPSILVNNSNKFQNKEAIYKTNETNIDNEIILSYAGYISQKKKNNNLLFDYETKEDLSKNQFLYNGDYNNKANCLLGTNYFYNTTPNLDLNDKIIILRNILKNSEYFDYLDKEDINYLEKLLLFFEKDESVFGKDYKSKYSEDLSFDKLDKKYFQEDIFTKEEALNVLENVIIEAYKRKGAFNMNSKLKDVYMKNYINKDKYYKNSYERNNLSPTKRVYIPPKEAIPCPLNPQEEFIKKDNKTLDDYMMMNLGDTQPKNCSNDENYMDSFNNSFI